MRDLNSRLMVPNHAFYQAELIGDKTLKFFGSGGWNRTTTSRFGVCGTATILRRNM